MRVRSNPCSRIHAHTNMVIMKIYRQIVTDRMTILLDKLTEGLNKVKYIQTEV